MPELPDLECYALNLNKLFKGATLDSLLVSAPKCVSLDVNDFVNKPLERVERLGKKLYFIFGEKALAVHLMLFGGFLLTAETDGAVIRMRFGNETLTVADKSGLCRVESRDLPLPSGAPDALSAEFDYPYFFSVMLQSPRKNVKNLLTDQNAVQGIGNAYADEILYAARISPLSTVGKIPERAAERLFASVKSVLGNAVNRILQINPRIISGEERSFLSVHLKKAEFTPTGERILKVGTAPKFTYYTKAQILYK